MMALREEEATSFKPQATSNPGTRNQEPETTNQKLVPHEQY